MLKPGLYEQVINKDISAKINEEAQLIEKKNIDASEAPQILSGYLSEIIEKGLSRLTGNNIEGQLDLANRIKKVDLFFVTLNKSDKDYSPTTMYNDYSINDTLFHWQSQSTTSRESKTGQRTASGARS